MWYDVMDAIILCTAMDRWAKISLDVSHMREVTELQLVIAVDEE